MTKLVYLKMFGIEFEVSVYYEDDSVCGVESVCVNGTPIECDTEKFEKELEGELQEALEEALRNDKIAAAEARYDAMKEEGLLNK